MSVMVIMTLITIKLDDKKHNRNTKHNQNIKSIRNP